jgi:hypothetical protein
LVVEAESAEDDDAEAIILKEVQDDNGDSFFDTLDDDGEFETISALFTDNSGEDYDVVD